MKIIEAICVDSKEVSRRQIQFDEVSGLITQVGGHLGSPDEVYGDECLLFAGMGDIHIHAREDVSQKNCYKEDFMSASRAMHNGGVTHAGDMPNNPIPPVDDASYEAKLKLAEKTHGGIWLYAGIGPGTRPLSYKVPYKVYMGPSIGELFFKDLVTLDETLSRYRGQVVSFHCEDPEILESHKGASHHHERRPASAEVVATRDALMLIEKYELKGKLCHYSTGEGLKLIREARSRGVHVDIEVTPQHLYFDMNHLGEERWQEFQMNPPIRSESDRLIMLEALKKGEINFLATDHAPHTHEEKLKGTSGLTGLDTYGPFVAWLYHQGFDPRLLAKVTAENPGDFHNQFLESWKAKSGVFKNYGHGVGYLKPNYRASFTVIDVKSKTEVNETYLQTKVKHSPFLGITLPGKVRALYVGGKKV